MNKMNLASSYLIEILPYVQDKSKEMNKLLAQIMSIKQSVRMLYLRKKTL